MFLSVLIAVPVPVPPVPITLPLGWLWAVHCAALSGAAARRRYLDGEMPHRWRRQERMRGNTYHTDSHRCLSAPWLQSFHLQMPIVVASMSRIMYHVSCIMYRGCMYEPYHVSGLSPDPDHESIFRATSTANGWAHAGFPRHCLTLSMSCSM